MNKIDGNKLVDLMFLPMTNEKIVNIIDNIGIDQPIISEEYEIEECVKAGLNQGKGIFFTFKEINGLSKSGEPNLTIISFDNTNTVSFPYDLQHGDSYEVCCKKLKNKADFYDDWFEENRIWRVGINNIDSGITLIYTDDSLQKLDGLIIHKFNKDKIMDSYIPNEEE